MTNVRFMGKIVGHTDGNIYYSDRYPKHFFVRYRGFGISSKVAKRLVDEGIETVNIIYHTKKEGLIRKYSALLEKFIRRGRRYTDRSNGHDVQYILPIEEMEEIK